MSKDELFLFSKFTLDCWDCTEDESGRHYDIALSARGLLKTETHTDGTAKSLVKGNALLCADGAFQIGPNLQFAAGITGGEARAILAALFEDMGRGSRYDGDWCWWPIDLEEFLGRSFSASRAADIALVLRRYVEQNNQAQVAAGDS